jgi:hypothetical protein
MIGIYHKYYCVNIEKLNLVCFVVNIACIVIIVVFLVRKLKIKKKKLFTKKKGFNCVIPKKITNIFWRRNMGKKVYIWGDSLFSEEICTFITLSKCVIKGNIGLRKKLIYVLDQHSMYMILDLGPLMTLTRCNESE